MINIVQRKKRFCKTGEFNGSSYAKILLRSNAKFNLESNDKYCFLCSIFASLYPCENDHPDRVSKYRQCFDELNIEEFDF